MFRQLGAVRGEKRIGITGRERPRKKDSQKMLKPERLTKIRYMLTEGWQSTACEKT